MVKEEERTGGQTVEKFGRSERATRIGRCRRPWIFQGKLFYVEYVTSRNAGRVLLAFCGRLAEEGITWRSDIGKRSPRPVSYGALQ